MGGNQENTVTAVNLALESVKNSSSLLPGLSLSYRNLSMLETSAVVIDVLADRVKIVLNIPLTCKIMLA